MKRNVLIINNSIHRGGVERQIDYAIDELVKIGWKVFYVFFNKEDKKPSNMFIEYFYIKWPFFFQKGIKKIFFTPICLLKILFYIKKNRIMLIHTYGPYENLVGSVAAKAVGIKHISSVRTTKIWAFKFIFVWKYLSDIIMTNSISIRKTLESSYSIPMKKIRVIRNGIDIENFPYVNKKSLVNKNEISIGLIGRINPSKNQLFFLEAFQTWRKRHPEKKCVVQIIGTIEDCSYFKRLTKFIEENGLREIITISSWIDDIIRVYQNIDLIVLSSLTEGVPNVLIEAMACGIPWVASNVADVPFLAGENMERGMVFYSNDLRSLIESLDYIFQLEDPQIREVNNNGRKFVEQNFSLHRLGRQIDELYIDVLTA